MLIGKNQQLSSNAAKKRGTSPGGGAGGVDGVVANEHSKGVL